MDRSEDEVPHDRNALRASEQLGGEIEYDRRDVLDRAAKTLIGAFGASAFAYIAGIESFAGHQGDTLSATDLERALAGTTDPRSSAAQLHLTLDKYREKTEASAVPCNCICFCPCNCTADCQCLCDGEPCPCDCQACGCNCNCGCECACPCSCSACPCISEASATDHASNREALWESNYSSDMHPSLDQNSERAVAAEWGVDGDTVSSVGHDNTSGFVENAAQATEALNTAKGTGATEVAQTETTSDDNVYHPEHESPVSDKTPSRTSEHRSAVVDAAWGRLRTLLR